MRTFKIGDVVSRAWNLAINNWPIFVLLAILNQLVSNIGASVDTELLKEYNLEHHPELFAVAVQNAIHISPMMIGLGFLLSIYFKIVNYKMLVNCVHTGKPYNDMADAFKTDFIGFAFFLGVSIISVLAIFFVAAIGGGIGGAIIFALKDVPIAVGIILAIILTCTPAIYLAIRWGFAPIIIATEKVPFLDAFRISWRITSGNVWKLVLLALTSVGVIILGLCACLIGVILAVVVVNFMFAVAYIDLREGTDATESISATEDTLGYSKN